MQRHAVHGKPTACYHPLPQGEKIQTGAQVTGFKLPTFLISISETAIRFKRLQDLVMFFLFRDSRGRLVNEPRVVMSWYALTSMATSQDFFCMQIQQLRSSLVKISRRSFEEVKMALVLNQVRCYFFDSLFEFFCWTVNMLSATEQFWY